MNKILLSLPLLISLELLLVGCGATPSSTPPLTPTVTAPAVSATPTSTPLPLSPIEVSLQLVAEGFASPVDLAEPQDGSGRLFIVDQIGLIRIVTPAGELLEEPFLDIRHLLVRLREEKVDERGLLGLAFHPNYQENGRFFIYYSAPLQPDGPEGWDHTNILAEYRVSEEDPNRADPQSGKVLLLTPNYRRIHNGGQLAFGPDGYLYLSRGDGGGAGDPLNNAQNIEVLQGKILRIDVEHGDPYAIPPDNPFVGREGADEIYAYGLRNPWRFSFDLVDGRIFVGDCGQRLREEVDTIINGGNYGWKIREGTTCFNPRDRSNPLGSCSSTGTYGEPFIDPIIEYDHSQGQCVIGGFVYRGSAIPVLYGNYIFADWGVVQGKLFGATPPPSAEGMWFIEELGIAESSAWNMEGLHILSFGQDQAGELYVLTTAMLAPSGNSGQVFKIIYSP